MTKFGVYAYDGYRGFYKTMSKPANTVSEVVDYLKNRFKQETELFLATGTAPTFVNGRKYEIRVGKNVVANLDLYFDHATGYNF